MSSNRKKLKSIRKWKDRPNKGNLKADMKRLDKNREILKKLAAEGGS